MADRPLPPAIQWTGENYPELVDWLDGTTTERRTIRTPGAADTLDLTFRSGETIRLVPGDWIARNPDDVDNVRRFTAREVQEIRETWDEVRRWFDVLRPMFEFITAPAEEIPTPCEGSDIHADR